MVPDAEAKTGPIMVNESGDSRYIRGGQWLRQFSFDELPQLWNVFKGDMSLVGPRPERPHFVQQFSRRVPFFNARHEVPVGITGWAQINGRSVLTRRPDQKIKYDIYYINHWSLLLDIKILIKTCAVVWSREESY
jgi:lipopolysaccharide/colanic/teichoic acid biosynthesis glycosyltransferase